MNIKFLSLGTNHACLDVLPKTPTTIDVIHSSYNDGHYTYHFKIEGTEEEIKAITRFSELIENAKPKIGAK